MTSICALQLQCHMVKKKIIIRKDFTKKNEMVNQKHFYLWWNSQGPTAQPGVLGSTLLLGNYMHYRLHNILVSIKLRFISQFFMGSL